MIRLSKRLTAIAAMVNDSNVIADIGCDHGYLPIALIEQKKVDKVYACDINPGPLDSAILNIKRYQLENQIQTRLGPGLKPVMNEPIDTVIIAGMGGHLITEILKENLHLMPSVNQIIVQPNRSSFLIRQLLNDAHWQIIDEQIIYENDLFYEMIKAIKVDDFQLLSEEELIFGPLLIKQNSDIVKSYWQSILDKKQYILNQKQQDSKLQSQINYLKQLIAK